MSFCPACGKAVGPAASIVPRRGRVERHLQILGILWLVLSVFRLIPAIVLLSIGEFLPHDVPPEVRPLVHSILSVIGLMFLAIALAGFAAGWGLLNRLKWARILSIVLACVSLIDIPFGLALGIYTLWVLLPAEAEEEYLRFPRP